MEAEVEKDAPLSGGLQLAGGLGVLVQSAEAPCRVQPRRPRPSLPRQLPAEVAGP